MENHPNSATVELIWKPCKRSRENVNISYIITANHNNKNNNNNNNKIFCVLIKYMEVFDFLKCKVALKTEPCSLEANK